MKVFSDRLEKLRGSQTQRAFAKKLGVPLNTYTNWVRKINCPKTDQLGKICTEFGVSSDWLLGLDDRAPPEIHAHNSAVSVHGHAVNSSTPAGPCPECVKKDSTIARLERVIDKLTK
jgi:transcriptional regulator with XRE-family HTH domain